MARGDTPQPDGGAAPDEPDAAPDGGDARQGDILAQFQDAIAGMRTREIQIGLRELLARSGPPPRTPGPPGPPARTAGPARLATADARAARPATADAQLATADAPGPARPATADARAARPATADARPARAAPARDWSEPGNGPAAGRGELRERSVQFRQDQCRDRPPR